jgi:hypothetical protein
MTRNERSTQAALLHNMSAPPKSVMKYCGLADLASTSGPGGSGVCSLKFKGSSVFGSPVRFSLSVELMSKTPAFILGHLGIEPIGDGHKQLIALIDARAWELTLPDGCAVIPALSVHPILWSDTLSTLAVLCKCSNSVWLRNKTTALSAGLQHTQVTLLVPPLFADRLPKEPL